MEAFKNLLITEYDPTRMVPNRKNNRRLMSKRLEDFKNWSASWLHSSLFLNFELTIRLNPRFKAHFFLHLTISVHCGRPGRNLSCTTYSRKYWHGYPVLFDISWLPYALFFARQQENLELTNAVQLITSKWKINNKHFVHIPRCALNKSFAWHGIRTVPTEWVAGNEAPDL